MELTLLSKEKTREIIAKRAAKEFKTGDVVTLGIGLPTEVANYIPENQHVIFQSENGLLGVGKMQPATILTNVLQMPAEFALKQKKAHVSTMQLQPSP